MTKQRITAIIAEFNPYHMGHRYLLEQAKLLGDKILVIMSGSFVQRGDIAILDPYTRANWAIKEGADAVIELPFSGSTSPADKFAEFAFKLLDGIDGDITLLFGSEDGDISNITNTSKILYDEPIEVKTSLHDMLDKGLPYPKSIDEAVKNYAKSNSIPICDLSLPNNALAIEYCKANLRRGCRYKLKTIKRQGSYKDIEITTLPSARAIRNLLSSKDYSKAENLVPDCVFNDFNLLKKQKDSSVLFIHAIQKLSLDDLSKIFDVSEGLEYRLKKVVNDCYDYDSLIANAVTKRYTTARIKRITSYALLGYTKDDCQKALSEEPLYNVLACSKESKELLSLFSNTPIFSQKDLSNDQRVQALFTYKAHEIGKLFWGYSLTHCDFK